MATASPGAEFCQYLGEEFKSKNRIFIVRHGLAKSNVEKVLVTSAIPATTGWGLVEKGKEQAEKAGEELKQILGDIGGEDVIVVSSNSTRARETAEIIHHTLDVKNDLLLDDRLRERNIGELNKKNYSDPKIFNVYSKWRKQTENDLTCALYGAECVDAIAKRMSDVVKFVNKEYSGKTVILVSHKEPLHVLHSLFKGWPLAKHNHTEPPITNGDVRELTSVL